MHSSWLVVRFTLFIIYTIYSQTTYIRKALADDLGIGAIDTKNMSVYTFGSREAGPPKQFDKYSLVVSGSYPSAQRLQLDAWNIEEISTVQPYRLTEFAKKLKGQGKVLADGRFIKSSNLPCRRLDGLLRLQQSPLLLQNYNKEMMALEERGFVERTKREYEGIHTYVPHHPVIRKDKSSTEIRPSFDASARGKTGPSLNECLEVGPNLNPDLPVVLLRFQTKKIACIENCSDIEKAFLNFGLAEEDTNAGSCGQTTPRSRIPQ